jgi:hypothetical protein
MHEVQGAEKQVPQLMMVSIKNLENEQQFQLNTYCCLMMTFKVKISNNKICNNCIGACRDGRIHIQ